MSPVSYSHPLPSPAELRIELPINNHASRTVLQGRTQIQDILGGKDKRLMVWLGPCSIHSTSEALEYARKLKDLANQTQDRLLLVMRCYFEKPRTTTGWKGLINEPALNGQTDYEKGLRIARKLLIELAEMGVYTCTEFLEPLVAEYIADLVNAGAIGARTTESQTHRTMVSGLSMPIGFKNGTDGSVQTAIDAVMTAAATHSFLGIDPDGQACAASTPGNPSTFIVLRGGRLGPNYDSKSIAATLDLLSKNRLPKIIMVDCSHGNSQKDYRNQGKVFKDLLAQRLSGNTSIAGLMLESNLCEGAQKLLNPQKLSPGISITDACIGWEETQALILDTYAQLPKIS